MLGDAAGGAPFYTHGETVSAAGEIYLVAYRAETKPIDWLALMRGGGRELPEPEILTAGSPLALALHADLNNERLPVMTSIATVKQALIGTVIETDKIGVHPGAKEPYQPNPSLSGKKLAAIEQPAQTVAFYAPRPFKDTRAVLYLDGHVEHVAETKWPALKKESRIP